MKPLVKYQGGKSRELKTITALMPDSYNRIIEPFCGGAAVSFHFGRPAVLNDTQDGVINLYNVVQSEDYYTLQHYVDKFKEYDHDQLEQAFYAARDVINNRTGVCNVIYAESYILVRQLCFSGMERYNAKGEFNVPFGHYKKFACSLSQEHHDYLRQCKIMHGDFERAIDEANEDDFIFVDPPYLERLGYETGDGSDGVHDRLLSALKKTKARWMIVHSDHEFYRDSYSDYNIMTKDFVYAQRFGKNKNHTGASVQHLYITNYATLSAAVPPALHPMFP